MRTHFIVQLARLAAVGVVVAAGCSPTEPPPAVARTSSAITFNLDTFTIPSGSEAFECFYTSVISDGEWAVPSAFGTQAVGGHHLTVYYNNGPAKPEGHLPCTDEEMLNWRLVAGTGGEDTSGAEGTVTLPEGLSLKIPQGRQIAIQAHYINATPKDVVADDHVTVNLTDPTKTTYANYLVANNVDFMIPQQTLDYHTEMSCSVPQDLQIVVYLGHMHEHGKHFQLAQLDEKGQVAKTLYEYNWENNYVSHPPVTKMTREQPLLLKKGTRLKVACDFANDTAKPLSFPREMCLAFMYYYPDAGALDCL
jgi:hypothetical protein